MERLGVLAPALTLLAAVAVAFIVYSLKCAIGRTPHIAGLERRKFRGPVGPFFMRFGLWVMKPVERWIVAKRINPNLLTYGSLLACSLAGLAIATGHMATAAWLYILGGLLDLLDGRLARATGQSSQSGAFLDSVADRWAELSVFAGFAWFLRDSPWLGALMLAVAGSVMVSYTRARGEGLGLNLSGGSMQRAERIAVVSIGTLVTAWFDAKTDTAEYAPHVIGVALLIVGVASAGTAVGRWIRGYRELRGRERSTPGPADAIGRPGANPTQS